MGWVAALRRCAAELVAAWKRRGEFRTSGRTRPEAEFLPAELEILDSPPWPLARGILWLIMALFVFAVAWAVVGRIDIVATARGVIIPDSRTKVIQAAVHGTVERIAAADGDAVRAGDTLLLLDATGIQAELSKARENWQGAVLQAATAGLLAQIDYVDDAPPALRLLFDQGVLAGLPAEATAAQGGARRGAPAQLARRRQLQSEQNALQVSMNTQQQQAVLMDDLILRDEEALAAQLQSSRGQLEKLHAEMLLMEEGLGSNQKLHDRGVISEAALREVEASMQRMSRELLAAEGQLSQQVSEGRRLMVQRLRDKSQFLSRAAEIEAQLSQLAASATAEDAQFRSEMLEAKRAQDTQAYTLTQEIKQLEQQLAGHAIVAPVDGVVEQSVVHAIGAVVETAQAVMVLVPSDVELFAEVEITNKDIGFVAAGQPVRVKLDAFPYTKYGLIEGELVDIADDAIEREGIGQVFRSRVKLLQSSFSADGREISLHAGMSLTAEIRTGERRVIEYFLDPFLRTRHESLNER